MAQVRVLSFHSIEPDHCTSYWQSANEEIFAFSDGKLHTCTGAGEPISPADFSFTIRLPEELDYEHVRRGLFPGLQVEDQSIETMKRFPHVQRFILSGAAVADQESPTRWFCLECSQALPFGWDAVDGCPQCDSEED